MGENPPFSNELFPQGGRLGILAPTSPRSTAAEVATTGSASRKPRVPRGRSAGVSMGLLVQSDMATPVIADLGTKSQIDEF
jgi:citronellyl-CoA dehydrogenase